MSSTLNLHGCSLCRAFLATQLPRRACPFLRLTTNISRAFRGFSNTFTANILPVLGRRVHVTASLISESNQRLMLACLGRLLCFTRTDIDKAHELPSQSSPRLYTPNHVPRSLTAAQPQHQRPLPPTDGTEDLDSMPPKRKNADTSAAMDRPEKKTKTARKGRKAAPAEEEGKPIFLSSFINMHATFVKRVSLVRRVSLVAAALIPRLGCTNKGQWWAVGGVGSNCCLDGASHLAQGIANQLQRLCISQSE
jgi:hypothetical protein